ncbi:hypothetical protein Bhyg_13099 [Pseudolycoriella hygida]|uniref:Uncharacterized protein n=1 Tax=Pseudolycoriella hygida TaxID=35572 RepID=A0A9Q0MZK1_9DIPT|nr:hypothetical protein Bhyg_13099 [Pseudolycoriella hygida]
MKDESIEFEFHDSEVVQHENKGIDHITHFTKLMTFRSTYAHSSICPICPETTIPCMGIY